MPKRPSLVSGLARRRGRLDDGVEDPVGTEGPRRTRRSNGISSRMASRISCRAGRRCRACRSVPRSAPTGSGRELERLWCAEPRLERRISSWRCMFSFEPALAVRAEVTLLAVDLEEEAGAARTRRHLGGGSRRSDVVADDAAHDELVGRVLRHDLVRCRRPSPRGTAERRSRRARRKSPDAEAGGDRGCGHRQW